MKRLRHTGISSGWLFIIPILLICSTAAAQVDAGFTTDTTQGCLPFTVHCTSTLNTNVIKWEWTTSDGQTSTEQNPVFTFVNPGRFTIKLKTSDYSLSDSAARTVTAYGIPAAFSYQYNSICTSPVPVQFKAAYTTTLGNYHWDFGDNTVSLDANPSHTYQSSGTYNIQLATFSKEGCADTLVKTLQTGQVTVDFTLPDMTCTNTDVMLTSTSTSLPASASWEINITVVSYSTTGFVYRFTEPGTYTVKLTQNFGGCAFSKTKQITVARRPMAAFTESGVLQSCIYPVPVKFTNASLYADNYRWDFGDSSQSAEASPLYSYTKEGRFTPVLIAANANGCADTISKPGLVFIGPPIIYSLRTLPQSRCLPDTVKTAAFMQTPEAIASYDWNFGNGDHSTDSMPVYTYTKQGHYNVTLIVKTVSGCVDTFFMKNAVSAGDSVVPDFTVNKTIACASDSFHFNAVIPGKIDGIQWNIGEDFKTLTGYTPSYRYHSSGSKTVSLLVSNNGCFIRTTKKDVVTVKPPVANIGVTYDCTNQLNVVFTDSSDGAKSWQWNFGDGTPETTVQHPLLHSYKASGFYTVTLHTANADCASTDTLVVPVLNTKPIFTFEPASGYLCRKAGITMGVTNPEYIADYYWDFDNGKSGFSTTSISTYYDKTGVYHPSLVTKYKNGCYDTLYSPQPVTVTGPTASFNTGAVANCVNKEVTFADKSTTDGAHSIVSWQWTCGDGYNENRTTSSFSHGYPGIGNYKASLVITDANNCRDTAYYTVRINNLPVISAGKDTFVCDGKNTVQLTASGGIGYTWQADATLSCSDCAAPVATVYQPSGYVVTGTDANGCAGNDTVQVSVVRPFNLVVTPSADICQAKKTRLQATGADLYSWQPSAGLSNPMSGSPYASPAETTIYTVTGADAHHCFSQTGTVTVNVWPNPVFDITDSLLVLQKGDINLLQTTGSADIESWQWWPSQGLSCADCAQPYLTAVKTNTYTAVATNFYGCTDTDHITIHVLCNQSKIYIPTAFSPNGDGKNDWFYVMSSIDNPVQSFTIYSRNGERVFSKTNTRTNNPAQGWNGMANGQPAATGTYVYRVEVMCNDAVVPLTGTVTIMR